MDGTNEARSDPELVAAARAGDDGALEALILRHQARVYRFGLRMCRDRDDARDVVQDTLLAVARKVGGFRAESSFSSWLFSIARRACLVKRRRRKSAPPREESLEILDEGGAQPADPRPGPEQQAVAGEIEAALAAAIDALDPGQREVLLLRDVEGLSAPEVAEALGLGVAAVKSRLHRARLAVREAVAPLLGAPARPAAPSSPACPDLPLVLSRYLEGEIAPGVCAELEAHLAGCAPCSDACVTLRRTLAVCRSLPAPDVPPAVAQAVRQALRAALRDRTGPPRPAPHR